MATIREAELEWIDKTQFGRKFLLSFSHNFRGILTLPFPRQPAGDFVTGPGHRGAQRRSLPS
jgi:hypothetical protein